MLKYMRPLVGGRFLKALFSVIVTSYMSLKGCISCVTNKIIMLQYKCSVLAIFLSFLLGNFLFTSIIIEHQGK
jgi:hypothetical protein